MNFVKRYKRFNEINGFRCCSRKNININRTDLQLPSSQEVLSPEFELPVLLDFFPDFEPFPDFFEYFFPDFELSSHRQWIASKHTNDLIRSMGLGGAHERTSIQTELVCSYLHHKKNSPCFLISNSSPIPKISSPISFLFQILSWRQILV
jgi:hypothetical protein